MVTCLGDVLRPEAAKATVRLLQQLGHEVEFPDAQTCCGQPMFNSGLEQLARQQALHTMRVFESAEVVVTPSGSCAAMVKVEYPHLFADDPKWSQRARQLADKTFEFSDFLVNQLEVVDLGARYEGRIAYHFACHLRMLQQGQEVRKLVEQIEGATYVSLEREDQCCGFGGSFAIRYPQISGAMVDDKMGCVLDAKADALVSTDAGCLMNIEGRLRRAGHAIEVLHIAELLQRR